MPAPRSPLPWHSLAARQGWHRASRRPARGPCKPHEWVGVALPRPATPGHATLRPDQAEPAGRPATAHAMLRHGGRRDVDEEVGPAGWAWRTSLLVSRGPPGPGLGYPVSPYRGGRWRRPGRPGDPPPRYRRGSGQVIRHLCRPWWFRTHRPKGSRRRWLVGRLQWRVLIGWRVAQAPNGTATASDGHRLRLHHLVRVVDGSGSVGSWVAARRHQGDTRLNSGLIPGPLRL